MRQPLNVPIALEINYHLFLIVQLPVRQDFGFPPFLL